MGNITRDADLRIINFFQKLTPEKVKDIYHLLGNS